MNKRLLRRLHVETYEARLCLNAVYFDAAQNVASGDALGATNAITGDVDNDGDLDVVAALAGSRQVVWYENLDGRGTFGRPREIAQSSRGAVEVHLFDLDGDGDLDVVTGWYDRAAGGHIAWHPNVDGRGQFEERPIIEVSSRPVTNVEDIDGDGDFDLVGRDGFASFWMSNNGRGEFSHESSFGSRAVGIELGDFDGDGDSDALVADYDAVYAYRNQSGQFRQVRIELLDDRVSLPKARFIDLDQDGDLDIVASQENPSHQVFWFENTDGRGAFAKARSLVDNGRFTSLSSPLAVADFDGDGDFDMITQSRGYVSSLYVKSNDAIEYRAKGAALQGIRVSSISVADMDGDGDQDLIVTSDLSGLIAVYHNIDGLGAFGNATRLSTSLSGLHDLAAADLDGDGDLDVLSASASEFAWYPNADGQGTFGPQRLIETDVLLGYSILANDIDMDGDIDVVGGSFDGTISWFENLNGRADFAAGRIVTKGLDGLEDVAAADIDGDGDTDLVSASRFDDVIAWYENRDGNGTFGERRVISTAADFAYAVGVGDMDGDGDTDVLSGASRGNQVAWYENLDGNGEFGPSRSIGPSGQPEEVVAADMDADGDLDVIVAAVWQVDYYENIDGDGEFTSATAILARRSPFSSVAVDDIDQDGDPDVVGTAANSLLWAENVDAAFPLQRTLAIAQSRSFVGILADIDGDADVDAVGAFEHAIQWYENFGVPGDINGDRVFSAEDLVDVFRAGEYEDEIANNSTLSEGDFDGNGDFTSSDLVFAFKHGHYESNLGPVARDVAAAMDAIHGQEQGLAFVA